MADTIATRGVLEASNRCGFCGRRDGAEGHEYAVSMWAERSADADGYPVTMAGDKQTVQVTIPRCEQCASRTDWLTGWRLSVVTALVFAVSVGVSYWSRRVISFGSFTLAWLAFAFCVRRFEDWRVRLALRAVGYGALIVIGVGPFYRVLGGWGILLWTVFYVAMVNPFGDRGGAIDSLAQRASAHGRVRYMQRIGWHIGIPSDAHKT